MAERPPSGSSGGLPDTDLPQKKRARRRVIGAAALALAAAIGLPLVLDSEPRQVRNDIEIRIPSRDTPVSERDDGGARKTEPAAGVSAGSAAQPAIGAESANRQDGKPGPADAANVAAPAATALAQAPGSAQQSGKPDAGDQAKARPEASLVPKPEARPEPKPEPKPVAKADPKPTPKAELKPAAKADPKPAAKTEVRTEVAAGAFQLQVGAFASEKAALDQTERVRKLGSRAYIERIITDQGSRFRVRVGPYPNRDAAEQARAKLRAAGIDGSVVAP